ncbi:hypothetical protein DPEC_G00073600 [Dallia pectoralis]|uniref:Uncharacterized protein n=1 Tax=Dallia pectoralis TaxID=75939 RepID=A0ACC2H2U0_DALPE|nr:hypothetical protein DPEC_G00073600 [Dallia pectoralis]
MYSVEDLLISHGYKLPQSTSTVGPSSASPTPPASYGDPASCRQEVLENRPGSGHGTPNGYETDTGPGVYVYGNSAGRQPPAPAAKGYANNTDYEWRDGTGQPQPREAESSNQGDAHSLGGNLTTDSGFCEGPRGVHSQPRGPRDVSYWRRRGQDFSVLLDYADFREPRGEGRGGVGGYRGTEVTNQQPQRQEVPPEDLQQHERHRWSAEARSRQREAALQQWRMAAVERKCQSLGPDEWRPAVVSFARQLSDSEGKRWTLEKQQRTLRTPDGAAVIAGPRNKGKSQSLPRMLQPDSLQYVDVSGQDVYRRVNGNLVPHHNPIGRYNLNQTEAGERWPENDSRPASQASMASQVSQVSQKRRFARPPRPPSYEVYQQTRGSSEMLSGEPAGASTPQPQARDRTPLPHFGMGDPRLDYYAQDGGTEPPGYIPPPSYPPRRAPPPIRGGPGVHRAYGDVPVNYRYHQVYQQQMRGTPDPWFGSRHGGGGSWPDPQRDLHRERCIPHRKQLYPGYCKQSHQQGLGPGVQYLPFDDPRVRHLGEGDSPLDSGGNAKTDSDKIGHNRNSTPPELPSVTVSDHSSDDRAFLSPTSTGGPPALASTPDPVDSEPRSSSDNENNRWQQQSDLHKEAENLDNFPTATDQNCNRYDPKNNLGCSAFQPPPPAQAPSSSDRGFSETTITQVKKIDPGDTGLDNHSRNGKRKSHSETIFCLVSVPIHMQQQSNKNSVSADQNNNEKMPASLPVVSVIATDDHRNTVAKSENNQSLRSKSLSDMGLKPPSHTSNFTSMRSTRKGPLRKEMVDVWSLQANADKELCYAGSWPGNQYRNAETQTCSPVTVNAPEGTRGTDQQSQGGQEPGHLVSDTTPEGGFDSDCSSGSYGVGFPMKGQKNLHPSSNSAFSRLSISPAQPSSLPARLGDDRDHHTSTSRKTIVGATTSSNAATTPNDAKPNSQGQVVFGQFLLKPVNRRPWDAIEELECFNKAAGVDVDRVQKKQKVQPERSSVDQCIDDLDEVYRNIMELSGDDTAQPQLQHQKQHTDHPPPVPEREMHSLPEQRLNSYKTSNNAIPSIRPMTESWGPSSSIDTDYRELRSAFSRPQPHIRTSKPRPLREDIVPTATLTQPTGFRDYNSHNAHSSPRLTHDPRPTHRLEQDIPVAMESLLRDVGLTVYTEGVKGKCGGAPFTVPPLLDGKALCQNVQLFLESEERPSQLENSRIEDVHATKGSKEELISAKEVEEEKVKTDKMPIVPPRFRGHEPNLNIRRARSENSRSPKGEGSQRSPCTGKLTREAAFAFEDDHYRYSISSDPLCWHSEATLADRHLETLLIKEKASAVPTEDLSNLYEVKWAKGIPENESMEQRAARILGIDVAPDSLQDRFRVRKQFKMENVEKREEKVKKEEQNEDNTDIRKEIQELSRQGAEAEESLGLVKLKDKHHRRENSDNEGRTPAHSPDRETPAHSPDRETPAHSPDRETPAHSPDTETPAPSPDTETPAQSPDTETPAHSPDTETPAHSPDTETPAHSPDTETPAHSPDTETPDHCPDEHRESQSVRRQYAQLMEVEVSVVTLEQETAEEGEGTRDGNSVDDNLSESENRHDGGENQSQPSLVLDLPEFPPSRLPLSLPPTPDEELALSLLSVDGGVEKMGCSSGGASPRIFTSSLSLGRAESTVHMSEVFSVSCISFRSLEAETDQEAHIGMSWAEEMSEENTEEWGIKSEPPGEENHRADEREDERMEFRLETETDLNKEVKKEMPAAEDEEIKVKRTGVWSNKPDGEQQQEVLPQEVLPQAASRPVKPPLLPKPIPMPRSGTVAKREISLPSGFNVSSCDSSRTLEEDLFSESYDPSRVERV